MQAEAPYLKGDQFDAARVGELIAKMVARGGLFVAVVARPSGWEGPLIGMAGCVLLPHFATGVLQGADLGVYVTPKHRGGWTVVRLVKAMEGWARTEGASRFMLLPASGLMGERTDALYERLGYTRVGSILEKTL